MITVSIDSLWFLLFLLAGPLFFTVSRTRLRAWVFLVASCGLYLLAMKSWKEVVGILIFLAVPGLYIVLSKKRSYVLWPFVVALTVIFVYLNGYTWLTGLLPGGGSHFFPRMLGLSYILFRQLDVMVHVRAGTVKDVRIVDYLNYLFSFYTVVAGPIQRFSGFVQSFQNAEPLTKKEDVLREFHRAANGMLKALVLGVLFKDISDNAFDKMVLHGGDIGSLLTILYCYPLFIYFNFSGYCDLVIALGRWAGFAIPENFRRPYMARNMIEFWNEWHITLSGWLRDFVYQPLFKFLLSGPLKRHLNAAQYGSIFVTFFVAGVWHGTTLNFVVFGVLHGLGMALSMIYRDRMIRYLGKKGYKTYRDKKKVAFVERLVTVNFVCFTFLFFEYNLSHMWSFILHSVGVS